MDIMLANLIGFKAMDKINLKTKWVSTGGWSGYSEPINAVCGANNTGSWSDSPCRTEVCLKELKMAKKVLKNNGIEFEVKHTKTSNVFCEHVYLVVHEDDKERAKELIKPLLDNTTLLYLV